MTIFAARRVLPPDLITPAKASKPFMKETGPEAIPPPESCSLEERMGERLLPVPEPHLKSIPSFLASSRIELIVSSMEKMNQFVMKNRGHMLAGEIAAFGSPFRNR